MDVFKSYKAEVENQLGKKIKAIKSYCGSEYYGRYDGSGELRPGPFVRYLQECDIVPQYTMLGTLSQNGVVERRKRTLKDMVGSMYDKLFFFTKIALGGSLKDCGLYPQSSSK